MSTDRVAVMTMVRDESVFLDLWLRHYRAQLPQASLFVLDHLTSDGSIDRAACVHDFTVVPETHPAYDDFEWYTARIEQFQRTLLEHFDVVVFAESDEMIWHRDGLSAYVAALDRPAVGCTGYQVIERPGEAPIDPARPLLEQRGTWFRRPRFDKALITTVPLAYEHGFHEVDPPVERDPDLLLVHLHTVDREWAHAKKRRITSYTDYDDATRNGRLGWHNRVVDHEFDQWWHQLEEAHDLEPIPAPIRAGFGL